jgi:hypothetical protein
MSGACGKHVCELVEVESTGGYAEGEAEVACDVDVALIERSWWIGGVETGIVKMYRNEGSSDGLRRRNHFGYAKISHIRSFV